MLAHFGLILELEHKRYSMIIFMADRKRIIDEVHPVKIPPFMGLFIPTFKDFIEIWEIKSPMKIFQRLTSENKSPRNTKKC